MNSVTLRLLSGIKIKKSGGGWGTSAWIQNTVCDFVPDGVVALAFLHREGKYQQAARPDLILLDLNVPKRDRREVIADIKQDPQLKRIPVVILTSSKAEQDIIKTYNLGANCYVTKPVDLDQFLELVKSIEHFWLTVVELPPQ